MTAHHSMASFPANNLLNTFYILRNDTLLVICHPCQQANGLHDSKLALQIIVSMLVSRSSANNQRQM